MAREDRDLALVVAALAGGVAAVAWTLGRAVDQSARAVMEIGSRLINPQIPEPAPRRAEPDYEPELTEQEKILLPWERWGEPEPEPISVPSNGEAAIREEP